MAGSFVWTLVLTDIASGWTECVPLLVREAGAVVDAVDRLRSALPFPLREGDTDNGSEFSERGVDRLLQGARHRADAVQAVSEERPSLGRAEERRGRPLTGRVRPSGRHAQGRSAGPPVTRRARLFVNVFQPSFKLAEKTRVGARVHKRYDAPETPWLLDE